MQPSADTSTEVVASVVMPALNAAETVGVQLDALAAQVVPFDWEVIVVDNGSSDGTVEIAESYRDSLPHLAVVTCSRPGANAARNVGAERARGRYLLLCDADDRVEPGWVTAMVAALHLQPLVGGLIDNESLSVGHHPSHPRGVPVLAGFLPRAITANLGVVRDVWRDVGGFAEDYAYGCTDTEFCWRLQLAGYPIGFAEDAVVAYRHRETLKSAAIKAYKTGRARGRLFRDFREYGMRQPRLVGAVYRWVRIAVTAPWAMLSPRFRATWMVEAAGAAGRIAGSIAFRVRYL